MLTQASMLSRRIAHVFAAIALIVIASHQALASATLEDKLKQLFVGRSFTIRNFYRGGHLRYGNDGRLVEKADAGFWSRDGMVQFAAVKISKGGALIMQGN